MAPLRILGRATSINVRKVLWACVEAGIPFAREDWGTAGAPVDSPGFRAMNPHALIPVIEVPDGFLWESNTICRYLAAQAGREDLLPAAPLARARVECWMDWQVSELNGAWRYAFMALVRRAPGFGDAAQLAASVAAWNGRMSTLDAQLGRTGAFVTGPEFTLADIVLGLSANRWRLSPIERPVLPAVEAWLARLAERPGCREHCLNGEP